MSWNDVQIFIRLLNSESPAKFSLPSEAQWEYACRAGGKAVKYGTENGQLVSDNAHYKNKYAFTIQVGRYRANNLGLHDMSGNVWEWVQDTYTKGYGGGRYNQPYI
ncbi:MAG: SUMF1/EgtB/PvdO family nonheme iron enzyme [SAR324 cluster bacterium]|nr:SUMF1/EgtB/PvdO family nonheme iron enzyme [SAR324 cluster bacterium]